jgi:hypothetical protein
MARMRWSWRRLPTAAVVAALALAGAAGCASGPPAPPPAPIGPQTGTFDCATPAVWTTTTFAALVPDVETALAQPSPQTALSRLLQKHAPAEVTCVVGYVHDQSVAQKNDAPSNALAAQRADAAAAWLQDESTKGLTVVNYSGEAH